MYCQVCGKQIPDGSVVCPECGARFSEQKFCKHCGQSIDKDCVICPKCGKQVEALSGGSQPNIVINNSNANTNNNVNTNVNVNRNSYRMYGRRRNKWVAFWLCLFLGYFGAHKFYEGNMGMGLLYFFTVGLFGIGWIIDIFKYLAKPNPYYV